MTAKPVQTLLAMAEKLKNVPAAQNQLTKKPKPLTPRMKRLLHVMLHEAKGSRGKIIGIKEASIKAGYSADASGYHQALRDHGSPQFQARLLEELAILVSHSLLTAHHTLSDVMVNSKHDLARVNAASETGKLFDRLVVGNEKKDEGTKGDTFIINLAPRQEDMKDITPEQSTDTV